jgi:hypothetical protein
MPAQEKRRQRMPALPARHIEQPLSSARRHRQPLRLPELRPRHARHVGVARQLVGRRAQPALQRAAAPSRSDARSLPCCAAPGGLRQRRAVLRDFDDGAVDRGQLQRPASSHSRPAARPPGARRAGAPARRPARGRPACWPFGSAAPFPRWRRRTAARTAPSGTAAPGGSRPSRLARPSQPCFSRRRNSARCGWPAIGASSSAASARSRQPRDDTGRGRRAHAEQAAGTSLVAQLAPQAIAQLACARAEVEAAVAERCASGPISWRLLAVTSWPPAGFTTRGWSPGASRPSQVGAAPSSPSGKETASPRRLRAARQRAGHGPADVAAVVAGDDVLGRDAVAGAGQPSLHPAWSRSPACR